MPSLRSDVPVIDIAPFLDGSGRAAVGAAVGEACREVGFFVITGHRVDPDLLATARRDAGAFFTLDDACKARYASSSFCGWSPMQSERLAYSLGRDTPPDLKEAFTIGRPDVTDDPYYHAPEAASLYPVNRFPAEVPTFAASAVALHRRLGDLAETMMEIFATALALPTGYFTTLLDKHFSFLRYVHYPAPAEAVLPGQLRAGAHTDYGSLTFVDIEDRAGGLQVLGPGEAWIDVPVVPGALVVNLGDLMQRWTNDVWRSTMHRVAVPDDDRREGSDRLSLVYFHEPNYDVAITPLPACVSAERPFAYPIVTAGQHLYDKVMRQQTLAGDAPAG